VALSKEQKSKVNKYWKKIFSSSGFRDELKNREEYRSEILKFLSKEVLQSLDELKFGEMIAKLWATNMWGNKDWYIQQIIDSNGLGKIKEKMFDLFYGSGSFEKRFDGFLKEIKWIGPGIITELLCLFNPYEYGIWNNIARKALDILGFNKLPLKKYNITGSEYVLINKTLKELSNYIKTLGYTNADLLAVDYFLYEILEFEKKERVEEEMQYEDSDFDHDEIRDFLRDIGSWLGFEVETEKKIAPGARVDCIWMAKIANLGVVTYVFEVQKSGSIDSLILNLQRALNNKTVQKLIAVSNESQLEKIRKEANSVPLEEFRTSLSYWNVADVIKTHERLGEVISSITKLELVKSSFEIEIE